ncbi:MAG: ABC transporter substrate-binding protein [Pseudomonadota bacterium]
MKQKKNMGFLLICLLLVLAFPMNSSAKKPESLSIAVLTDLTGPYASAMGPIKPGTEDAIKYVNEELGGIDGVKLEMIVRDNTGKTALALQQYAEVVGMQPRVFLFSMIHTPMAEALRDKMVQDDVIAFVPSSVEDLYPVGNSYGTYTLYSEQGATFVRWLRANWKEKRNPRVAMISWDSSYGRSIMVPEALEYCKKMKVDVVAKEVFGYRDVDLTTHMARIRAKKPDWLMTCSNGAGPVAIMKAVRELKMNIRLANTVGGNHGTIDLAPELFENCITVFSQIAFDDRSHPGMQKLMTYFNKNNRTKKDRTMFYVTGWQVVLMIHKVLGDAVAKVGWDNLNTAAIKNELNNLKNWELFDGIIKVSYSEKRRSPDQLIVYKIKNGEMVPAGGNLGNGEWIECPDLRPAKFK